MQSHSSDTIQQLSRQLSSERLADNLALLLQNFPGRVVFSTSFSYEDQVITHLLASHELPVGIFTLDTGRLFPETYAVWSRTVEKYGIRIKAFYPDAQSLESFITAEGPNAFYHSVDNRKACCHIRKVEPLRRALSGNRVWITGLRAEHSAGRSHLSPLEWDETNQVIKYHPLLNWTTTEVKEYINRHAVPYNPLHDRGFVSIGCAPCTRAIREGEDFRAGRWWWEDSSKKECGLHER